MLNIEYLFNFFLEQIKFLNILPLNNKPFFSNLVVKNEMKYIKINIQHLNFIILPNQMMTDLQICTIMQLEFKIGLLTVE